MFLHCSLLFIVIIIIIIIKIKLYENKLSQLLQVMTEKLIIDPACE